MPASNCYSIDSLIVSLITRRKSNKTVPFWCIWILRILLAMVYFHAGILHGLFFKKQTGLAKINEDWLIYGEPFSHWLFRNRVKYTHSCKLIQFSTRYQFLVNILNSHMLDLLEGNHQFLLHNN